MNKKRHSLNAGALICLGIAIYIICHLLWHDNAQPLSISSVLSVIHNCASDYHVLAVGLLPVYIALMFFGASVLGVYLGSALQRWISHFIKQK